jgi:hypothetical protein
MFWRPQHKKPDTHLATIEAIYHFFRQLAGEGYNSELDNLLFWFVHQWELIERTYDADKASERPRSRKLATSAFARSARRPPQPNTAADSHTDQIGIVNDSARSLSEEAEVDVKGVKRQPNEADCTTESMRTHSKEVGVGSKRVRAE